MELRKSDYEMIAYNPRNASSFESALQVACLKSWGKAGYLVCLWERDSSADGFLSDIERNMYLCDTRKQAVRLFNEFVKLNHFSRIKG